MDLKEQNITELSGGALQLKKGVSLPDALDPLSMNIDSDAFICYLALGCTFSTEVTAAFAFNKALQAQKSKSAFNGVLSFALMRSPMNIDAADCFSEDAYLTAQLCHAYLKTHFLKPVVINLLGQGVCQNRSIDPRALNELYLYPLRFCAPYIKAAAFGLDYLNGNYICQSESFYEKVRDLSQDAFLINAYGAVTDSVDIASRGIYQLNLSAEEKKELNKAVLNGEINSDKIKTNSDRLLKYIKEVNEYYQNPVSVQEAEKIDILAHSTVMLKNEDLLPLSDFSQVNWIGDPSRFEGYKNFKQKFITLKEAALKGEKLNKISVVILTNFENGISSSEKKDLLGICAHSKTVVILSGTNACEIEFLDAGGLLFAPYNGEFSRLLDILIGEAEPQGRLPFSWAVSAKHYPCARESRFVKKGFFCYESVFNGYRFFDNFDCNVLYEFGYGLGYTDFEFSNLKLSLNEGKIEAAFDIQNIKQRDGSAVAQAYIDFPNSKIYGVKRRLAAFKKVFLKRGEKMRVILEINAEDFAVYDDNLNALVNIGGRAQISVGTSCKNIVLSDTVKLPNGVKAIGNLSDKALPSYYKGSKNFMPSGLEVERLLDINLYSGEKSNLRDIISKNYKIKALKKMKKKLLKSSPAHLKTRLLNRIDNTVLKK